MKYEILINTQTCLYDTANGDRYEIVRPVGDESGSGCVFLAERQQELSPEDGVVRSRVALKLLKSGSESADSLTRFEREGQLLALLHHPNIARVYKMGEFDDGRHFIAMEFVDGVPITNFCDAGFLTVRSRLELFLSLCSAVQHAHQKGVIHRDLQPSNVLVTTTTDSRTPFLKLIDFGIADFEWDESAEIRADTELIGVPQYMSPEQLGGGSDIDTRSDVYSLGVILYELLTGTIPIGGDTTSGARDFLELLKQIRLEAPPTPSGYLQSLGEKATSVAEVRSTRISSLSRSMRGEVDWIVMKALEKDRGQRYDSVSALANDVSCYLTNQPLSVTPRTWSTAYVFGKFVKRHRPATVAVVAVTALLVSGTAFSSIMYRRAKQAQPEIAQAIVRWDESIQLRKDARNSAHTLANDVFGVLETKRRRDEAGLVKSVFDAVKDYQIENSPNVDLIEATTLWDHGHPEEALETINTLNPATANSPETNLHLVDRRVLAGRIYRSIGKLSHAREEWQAGLALLGKAPNQKLDSILARRANLYGLLGDAKAMRRELEKSSNRDQPMVSLDAGATLLEAREFDRVGKTFAAKQSAGKVLHILREAVRKWGTNLPADIRLQRVEALRFRAGLVHRHAKWPHEIRFVEQDLDEALKELQQIRSLDRENVRWQLAEAQLHHQLGNAYRDLDLDMVNAHQHYQNAKSISEDTTFLYQLKIDRARAFLREGDTNSATEVLTENPATVDQTRPSYFELRGEIAMMKGRFSSAYAFFKKAVDLLSIEFPPRLAERSWLSVRRAEALVKSNPKRREEAEKILVGALGELEQRHTAVPLDQDRLIQIADALRVLAEIVPDSSKEHLARANEILDSNSLSLRVLQLRNQIRARLAALQIASLTESLPEGEPRSNLLKAEEVLNHSSRHSLGRAGAIIEALDLIEEVEQKVPEIRGIKHLLGTISSSQNIPSRPNGPGSQNPEYRLAWEKSFSGMKAQKGGGQRQLGEARAILEKLVESVDANEDEKLTWNELRARNYARLGRHYRKSKNWAKSTRFFGLAIDLQEMLAEQARDSGTKAKLELNLAFYLSSIATGLRELKEPYNARIYSDLAIEKMEALASQIPESYRGLYLESLGVAHYNRLMTDWNDRDVLRSGSITRMNSDIRQSMRIRAARFYHQPGKIRWRRYLAESHHGFALLCSHEGQMADAAHHAETAARLAKSAFISFVDSENNKRDSDYLHEWLKYSALWAEVLHTQQDPEGALLVLDAKHAIGPKSFSVLELAEKLTRVRSRVSFQDTRTQLLLQRTKSSAEIGDGAGSIEDLKKAASRSDEAVRFKKRGDSR